MPAVRAERLCPNAAFVPPDFARYKIASRQIREIFSRHTDLVEPLSLDEAYLDVTNPKTLMSSATAIAEAIRTAISEETGLTASAGVASNKFLAKIASDWLKPNGLFVIRPRQARAFLSNLPVARLPGVGKVMAARLSELSIGTCEDLRTHGSEALEGIFGRWGRRLYELSLGIDESAVVSERPTTQVSSEDTFEWDLPLNEIEPHIRRLASKTWLNYVRGRGVDPDRLARTVVLKLKTSEFQIHTRSLTPPAAPISENELAEIACGLIERVGLPAGTKYRLVGVGLANIRSVGKSVEQEDLFRSGNSGS